MRASLHSRERENKPEQLLFFRVFVFHRWMSTLPEDQQCTSSKMKDTDGWDSPVLRYRLERSALQWCALWCWESPSSSSWKRTIPDGSIDSTRISTWVCSSCWCFASLNCFSNCSVSWIISCWKRKKKRRDHRLMRQVRWVRQTCSSAKRALSSSFTSSSDLSRVSSSAERLWSCLNVRSLI